MSTLLKRFLLGLALMVSPLMAQVVYQKILPLAPEEGVFAYSRISPDGALLSYASETREKGVFLRTANVIELATGKVLFSWPGMDAYWSPEGDRLIFLHTPPSSEGLVCVWNRKDGTIQRDVAPESLGHYFSWGKRDGKDLILTQNNYYYGLEGGKAVRPYRMVPAFPPLGSGSQPMLSKDGKLIATFHRGTLLIRGLDEPKPLIETRIPGGKGDFSHDGRYVAFHRVQKIAGRDAYQIFVVDLKTRELIQVTQLPGSCYYPSWTRDGRLVFRYDSTEYRGFMMASGFMNNPRVPLPSAYPDEGTLATSLSELIIVSPRPTKRVVMVNFWAGWCVHCRGELPILDQLRKSLVGHACNAEILGACDPTSFRTDREFILRRSNLDLPQIDITSKEITAFGIQVYPTTLMFVDGKLVEKHQGALTEASATALFRKYGIQIPTR